MLRTTGWTQTCIDESNKKTQIQINSNLRVTSHTWVSFNIAVNQHHNHSHWPLSLVKKYNKLKFKSPLFYQPGLVNSRVGSVSFQRWPSAFQEPHNLWLFWACNHPCFLVLLWLQPRLLGLDNPRLACYDTTRPTKEEKFRWQFSNAQRLKYSSMHFVHFSPHCPETIVTKTSPECRTAEAEVNYLADHNRCSQSNERAKIM